MTKKKSSKSDNKYNNVVSFEDKQKKHGSLIDDIVNTWRKYKDDWRKHD